MGSGAASAPPARECARPSGNRPSKYVIIFTNMSTKSSGRTKASGCGEGDDDALARRLPSRSCADDDRVAKITKFEGFLDERLKPGVRRTSTTIAVTGDTEGDRRDLAIFRRQVSYLVEQLVAIFIGHRQISDDDVRPELGEDREDLAR